MKEREKRRHKNLIILINPQTLNRTVINKKKIQDKI